MASATDDTQMPIFPLGTVLFPGGLLPLRIFETRYMDMARACLRNKTPFGVCLIKSGREVGEAAVPEKFGTLAEIVDCDMQQLGLLLVKARGTERFEILEHRSNSQGLVLAHIERLPPEPDLPLDERFAPVRQLLQTIIAEHQDPPVFFEPYRLDSTSWVGQRLADIVPISAAAKLRLLEMDDCEARLEILFRFLEQRGVLGRK